jgi:hypothetical protein
MARITDRNMEATAERINAESGFRVMQLIEGDEFVHCERPTYEEAAAVIESLPTRALRPEFSIWEVGGGIVGVVDPATGVVKRVMEDEPERGRGR